MCIRDSNSSKRCNTNTPPSTSHRSVRRDLVAGGSSGMEIVMPPTVDEVLASIVYG